MGDQPSAASGTTAGARLSEDELWLDQVRGDVEAGFPFGSKKMARVLAWLDAVRLERDAARQWSARWKEAATSKRVEHESLHDHLCLVVSTWEQALVASEARVAQLEAALIKYGAHTGMCISGAGPYGYLCECGLFDIVDAKEFMDALATVKPGASPAAVARHQSWCSLGRVQGSGCTCGADHQPQATGDESDG